MAEKTMSRWIVVVGAILIQLALGAIYAWSVFTPGLTEKGGDFEFTKVQTQIIFSTGLAVFGVMTVVAGRLLPKIGPRNTALAGGGLLGLGYILAGFLGTNFIMQLVLIGIVGGAGIGLAYVVPLGVGVKWFPDKKGLITGLGVAGFGFGATIWVKLGEPLISNMGILQVFMIYGFVFLAMVVIGAFTMKNPPEGYTVDTGDDKDNDKDGKEKDEEKEESKLGTVEYEWKDMIKTPQFWVIWILFVFGALAGLMVIGNIKLFGIGALEDSGMSTASASAAAGTAMAIYAITNGIGRIAWGTVSDKIGRKMAVVIMSAIQGVMMLALFSMGSNVIMFTIAAAIIGFNFGGNFALFPAATADFFGTKSLGKNYGFVFTSYAVGGIVGPILGGIAAGSSMGYTMAFYPAGILCLLGAVIAFVAMKPPKDVAE